MEVGFRAQTPAAPAEQNVLAAGFFGLQLLLGYEWIMSGISKVVAGDFASGLAGVLEEMTQDQSGWYKSFIDGTVIPNAELFGYLVIAGELAVGLLLIGTALTALLGWGRLAYRSRIAMLTGIAMAGIAGAVMSLNFHLAMGAPAPWLVSPDPNDQGIDLDSLLFVMQLVLVAVSLRSIGRLRRERVRSA